MSAVDRRGWGAGAFAVASVFLAAVLEAGILPEHGGVAIVIAGLGVCLFASEGGGVSSRAAKVAAALLTLTVLWQVLPVPTSLRGFIAPGQAAWLEVAAPEWSPDATAFSQWLTQSDLAAALGDTQPPYDMLSGAVDTVARTGSTLPSSTPWLLAQLAGVLCVYTLGARAARERKLVAPLLAIFLCFAVAEALFGLAMRNGPSTGIGTKVYYLGSATGTFINRGHFAVFLTLGIAACSALAGAQFPLLPEEVERHSRRSRRSSQPPGVLEASGNRVPKLVLLGFFAAILGVGIVASQSRGPLVALVVCALALGVWAWRARNENFYLYFGVGFPLFTFVVAGLGFGVRGAFGRFAGLLAGGGDVSVASRAQFWRDGLHAWLDAPVFGAGFGAWRLAYGVRESVPHLYDVKHAHSELIEWMVEAGIVGTAGLLIAVAAWFWGVRRGLRALEHDARSASVIGCALGVMVAIIVSISDFPMRAPGSALAVALFAGLATGGVVDAPIWGRAARALIGASAVLLGSYAAWTDHASAETPAQRLGEIPADFQAPAHVAGIDDASGRWLEARALLSAAPLDPWRQMRVARAATWMNGLVSPRVPVLGLQRDGYALQAELALARVHALRPNDARLAVLSAAVLLDLEGVSSSRRLRARDLLVHAVQLDFWRAETAFGLADRLEPADAELIAAQRGSGKRAARVDYYWGQSLARRHDGAAAAAAYQRSAAEDPDFGPPSFQLAAISYAAGDVASTTAAVRVFLDAKDKPIAMEGWAYLMIGNVESAESRLRSAVDASPTNRWAWEGLAEVYAQRGDKRAEAAVWSAVLKLDPHHTRAAARLKALQ